MSADNGLLSCHRVGFPIKHQGLMGWQLVCPRSVPAVQSHGSGTSRVTPWVLSGVWGRVLSLEAGLHAIAHTPALLFASDCAAGFHITTFRSQ